MTPNDPLPLNNCVKVRFFDVSLTFLFHIYLLLLLLLLFHSPLFSFSCNNRRQSSTGHPAEFSTYLSYCRSLRFEEKPNYAYLQDLLKQLFYRERFTYDDRLDWVILKHQQDASRSGSKSKSPGERTDTSMRGSSKTHTLCMELTRAMGFLRRVTPDHKSSNFKRHHARVMKGMEMAEKHLREDEEAEIDVAYEEHLLSCIDEAEVLLSKVDEEGDKVEQGRQKRKEENDLISKTLPRTHAIKWNGTRQDYMRFKQEALTLMRKI